MAADSGNTVAWIVYKNTPRDRAFSLLKMLKRAEQTFQTSVLDPI